jgi:hypothetical protein
MTIADIIRRGKGTAHAWRVERGATWARRPEATATLYHYGTAMLSWNVDQPDDPDTLSTNIGWGSVSDQNGMNTAFKVLGLPYRYDRNARGGGPRITELRRHACGHATDPSVEQCCAPPLDELLTELEEDILNFEMGHPID